MTRKSPPTTIATARAFASNTTSKKQRPLQAEAFFFGRPDKPGAIRLFSAHCRRAASALSGLQIALTYAR
ncbi:hypothetical protein C8256_18570 [Kluyvera genomosp. 2]|uniref:Uncharacterized protein n=1 Tax=Kluyvera genomosp. 2 TaxID=2774054 RepID=A0A2T2XYH3_9ENTR|nr:hypothetical protein C8256_18570 [Kluyvera genomosp. 2]